MQQVHYQTMDQQKTSLEIIANERYPIPAKCCAIRLRQILAKRKLLIERLQNDRQTDSEIIPA